MIKNKKILILGGSGFIGKNVIKHYYKNNDVTATFFKNKKKIFNNIRWKKVDLTKKDEVIKIIDPSYDIVIQCAAVTAGAKKMKESPFIFITDNMIMNSNIIRTVADVNIKNFIFLSCTVMYHNSKTQLREIDFDPRKKIIDSYEGIALTKVYLENICKYFSERSNTKFTVLRHTNIYGPYDKFNSEKSHFFAALITKIFNKDDNLEIWGDGSEKRDFLYIDDFLNGLDIVLAKQVSNFKLYNMSYGKCFSVKEIVKKTISISKIKKQISFNKNKPTIKINLPINSNKIKKELNWHAKTKIDVGIKKTIDWYLNKFN